MRIVSRPYDHADAAALVKGLQAEYVLIYGSQDESPIDGSQFSPPHGNFAVRYDDETPVAIGGWRLRDDGRAELKRMYVADPHRGNGHSRSMLNWLEASAVAAGVHTMVLETNERHPAALSLYRSAGYTPVPAFGFYADNPESVYLGRELSGISGRL